MGRSGRTGPVHFFLVRCSMSRMQLPNRSSRLEIRWLAVPTFLATARRRSDGGLCPSPGVFRPSIGPPALRTG